MPFAENAKATPTYFRARTGALGFSSHISASDQERHLQKFGLDTLQSQKLSALELEIVKEQATALGIAGRKLRISLESYSAACSRSFPNNDENLLLGEVAESVYGLIIQREFIGFIEGNLDWVRKHYTIPDEAITMLGTRRET